MHSRPGSRRREVDLVDLGAPSQVKSFLFQVAAELFHISRRRTYELKSRLERIFFVFLQCNLISCK